MRSTKRFTKNLFGYKVNYYDDYIENVWLKNMSINEENIVDYLLNLTSCHKLVERAIEHYCIESLPMKLLLSCTHSLVSIVSDSDSSGYKYAEFS
jgi:hypothetical protein